MAFQVVVYPSDLTPPTGDAYLNFVAEVLERMDATWIETAEEGELKLVDGSEIALFHDDEDNVAWFVLEDHNEAAFDLIYALAEQGAAFVKVEGERPCALPPTGDPLPAHQAVLGDPDDLPNRRAFGDWMREAIAASRLAPEVPPPPQRSLIQRLSDALFGKEM